MIHALGERTPSIHPDAFVHPDATVIGSATVGRLSSIWPGTVLRADMGSIAIGEESSVQDGTIAHLTEGLSTTRVGDRCTVGHRVILHGCTVEDDCLVGMGAILLDNVVVGCGSLIAAGALVTAGTIIPPGSVVMGAPARVVRSVGDKERAMIALGHRTYVEYARRYRTELAR